VKVATETLERSAKRPSSETYKEAIDAAVSNIQDRYSVDHIGTIYASKGSGDEWNVTVEVALVTED